MQTPYQLNYTPLSVVCALKTLPKHRISCGYTPKSPKQEGDRVFPSEAQVHRDNRLLEHASRAAEAPQTQPLFTTPPCSCQSIIHPGPRHA